MVCRAVQLFRVVLCCVGCIFLCLNSNLRKLCVDQEPQRFELEYQNHDKYNRVRSMRQADTSFQTFEGINF